MKSWYPATIVQPHEQEYLQSLQYIWRVKTPDNEYKPYILAPHQIEWHRDDVTIQQENAVSRVVIKSRNTSFTTSAIISNLMAVPYFPNVVIPFIRLNMQRANDMIKEAKVLIENMRPIKLPNGELYPFDPSQVDMGASGSIKFPNGFEIRAFPATNASAENIRGLRIIGAAGIIDESNFMKDFKSLYIASRDASAGGVEGKKVFQMNIGTTLKGLNTPFKLWFDDLKRQSSKLTHIKIYEWPVFEPSLFDSEVPPIEQEHLTPIVPWHDITDLNDKYLEDKNTFLQEYMAQPVEAETAFYSLANVMECVEEGRKSLRYDVSHEHTEGKEYNFGVDPAGEGGDFFSIVGVNKDTLEEEFLYCKQYSDLDEMQEYCERLFDKFPIHKMRIDGNGLGYQLAQSIKKKFPSQVEIIRGTVSVKIDKRQSIPFKEFLHTNLKKHIVKKELTLIDDDMHVRHFSGWDYRYECERSPEYGHGDSVIALGLAVLSDRWRYGERAGSVETTTLKEKPPDYSNNIMKRLEWYRRQQKHKKLR